MKIKIFCAAVLISTSVIAAEPKMPEQMMRGHSSQYQDGFRDGFREAVRMMNGGGHSGGGWNKGLQIVSATYGGANGRCDFTQKLARSADGKSSYSFKAGNQWCGDPSDGYQKTAMIEYLCRGDKRRAIVRERSSEILRCN